MDSVSGVGVLDKAVRVVDAVRDGAHTLAQLTAVTGLPRATAHRLATALVAHGWLRRVGEGAFDLGLGLISLGQRAADGFPLAERARPIVADLRDETGESTQLFVAEPGGRRCVVAVQSAHGLRWIVAEGALLPARIGSAGHVLEGELGPQGWIDSVEEREPGVASVSAPVSDAAGRLIAAVSVSGPVERLGRRPGDRLGPAVVAAASRIAATLS